MTPSVLRAVAKASSVGANTVKGPSLLRVSTSPAGCTAATRVGNVPASRATSTMVPGVSAASSVGAAWVGAVVTWVVARVVVGTVSSEVSSPHAAATRDTATAAAMKREGFSTCCSPYPAYARRYGERYDPGCRFLRESRSQPRSSLSVIARDISGVFDGCWAMVPGRFQSARLAFAWYVVASIGSGVIGSTTGSGPVSRGSSPLSRAVGNIDHQQWPRRLGA